MFANRWNPLFKHLCGLWHLLSSIYKSNTGSTPVASTTLIMSGLQKAKSRAGTKTGTHPLCSANTYKDLFVSSALLSFGDFLARGTLFAKIFPSVQTSVVDGEGVQTSDRPPLRSSIQDA
jgi:hypothetical protein